MSNLTNFDPRAIHDLNIPSERVPFQLLNATFILEIGPSYLKLWPADYKSCVCHIDMVKVITGNKFAVIVRFERV